MATANKNNKPQKNSIKRVDSAAEKLAKVAKLNEAAKSGGGQSMVRRASEGRAKSGGAPAKSTLERVEKGRSTLNRVDPAAKKLIDAAKKNKKK